MKNNEWKIAYERSIANHLYAKYTTPVEITGKNNDDSVYIVDSLQFKPYTLIVSENAVIYYLWSKN